MTTQESTEGPSTLTAQPQSLVKLHRLIAKALQEAYKHFTHHPGEYLYLQRLEYVSSVYSDDRYSLLLAAQVKEPTQNVITTLRLNFTVSEEPEC